MNQNKSLKEEGWDRMQNMLHKEMPVKGKGAPWSEKKFLYGFLLVILGAFFIHGILLKGISHGEQIYSSMDSAEEPLAFLPLLNPKEAVGAEKTLDEVAVFYPTAEGELEVEKNMIFIGRDQEEVPFHLVKGIDSEKVETGKVENSIHIFRESSPLLTTLSHHVADGLLLGEDLENASLSFEENEALQENLSYLPSALGIAEPLISGTTEPSILGVADPSLRDTFPNPGRNFRFSISLGNDWVFQTPFSYQPNLRFSYALNAKRSVLTTFVGMGFAQLGLQRDYVYREIVIPASPGGEELFVVSETAYLHSLREFSTELGLKYRPFSSLYVGMSLQPSFWQFTGHHLDKIQGFRNSGSSSAYAWVFNAQPVVGYAFSERLGIQCNYTININQFSTENLFKETQGLRVNRLGLGLFFLF
jgi:hypothetical protein